MSSPEQLIQFKSQNQKIKIAVKVKKNKDHVVTQSVSWMDIMNVNINSIKYRG